MTTGRINQIANVISPTHERLRSRGVRGAASEPSRPSESSFMFLDSNHSRRARKGTVSNKAAGRDRRQFIDSDLDRGSFVPSAYPQAPHGT